MNQKYVMNMMEIASDFDAISTELFALSHNAASILSLNYIAKDTLLLFTEECLI